VILNIREGKKLFEVPKELGAAKLVSWVREKSNSKKLKIGTLRGKIRPSWAGVDFLIRYLH